MSDEKQKDWVGKSADWVKRNPTLTGAAAGFAAGSVIPGLGNIFGAVGGAIVGHLAGKDAEKK